MREKDEPLAQVRIMPPLIFDDNGKLWHRDSPAFRMAFCVGWLKEDPTSFFVEQLGGVGVWPYRDGTVLHFNPERVSEAALAGFYGWLRGRPCSRVCLAYGTRTSGVNGQYLAPSVRHTSRCVKS